jgi:hypothetical protein
MLVGESSRGLGLIGLVVNVTVNQWWSKGAYRSPHRSLYMASELL